MIVYNLRVLIFNFGSKLSYDFLIDLSTLLCFTFVEEVLYSALNIVVEMAKNGSTCVLRLNR